MIRSGAIARACTESLDQFQERRALFFNRRRTVGLQPGRSRRALREGNHIQKKMLEGKHVKHTLVCRRNLHLAEGHECREMKMLQHAGYVQRAPSASG